jgi:DNA-binding CsgD family transcriptional regulator
MPSAARGWVVTITSSASMTSPLANSTPRVASPSTSTRRTGGDGGSHSPPQNGEAEALRQRYEQGLATLTRRERQVMELVVRGQSSREMARILDLAPKTIEGYRARVKEKMQVKSLAELVRLSLMSRTED